MPIYEYRCKKCKDTFEVFHRSPREELEIICPVCGSKKAGKLMSRFGGKFGNTSSSSCSSCSATSCSTT